MKFGGEPEPVVRTFRRAVYPFPDAQGRGPVFHEIHGDGAVRGDHEVLDEVARTIPLGDREIFDVIGGWK